MDLDCGREPFLGEGAWLCASACPDGLTRAYFASSQSSFPLHTLQFTVIAKMILTCQRTLIFVAAITEGWAEPQRCIGLRAVALSSLAYRRMCDLNINMTVRAGENARGTTLDGNQCFRGGSEVRAVAWESLMSFVPDGSPAVRVGQSIQKLS